MMYECMYKLAHLCRHSSSTNSTARIVRKGAIPESLMILSVSRQTITPWPSSWAPWQLWWWQSQLSV